MNKLKTKDFWEAAAARAIRTIAQTFIGGVGTAYLFQEVNWLVVGSASLLAGIVSLATSIATSLPEIE